MITITALSRQVGLEESEIQRWVEYDYVIVNDDLQNAFRALQGILAAERLKRARRTGLAAFVDGLLAETP